MYRTSYTSRLSGGGIRRPRIGNVIPSGTQSTSVSLSNVIHTIPPTSPPIESMAECSEPIHQKGEYVPVLGSGALDAHFFDDKLENLMGEIMEDVTRVNEYPKERIIDGMGMLRRIIADRYPNATNAFDVIIRDFENDRPGNVDPRTQVNAGRLMYILYEMIIEDGREECIEDLAIQLTDMSSGLSVRVARLLQVIVPFR